MPAARATRQNRASPLATSPKHSNRSRDVIELPSRPAAPTKRKPRHTEVIEISSDDDEAALPAYEAARADALEAQVKKLKAELAKSEADKKRIRKERTALQETVEKLQASKAQDAGDEETIAISKLEDDLTCEICSMKMWHPYILPKCGHTFCETCLHGWFTTTTTQYQATHPNYNPNLPIPMPNFLRDTVYYGQIVPRQLINMVNQLDTGGPSLTCPTCREAVKVRPVECFAIKSLVRTVGSAQGEESPKKPAAAKGRGKHRAPVVKDPWAVFFPS
ncbi:hypothetical protein BDZ89DRAFT_1110202 [Hymenopellis radicata]|nr:hypothetical protein BDZ89DRAFT_1110202 [Hymenopellis radicata]